MLFTNQKYHLMNEAIFREDKPPCLTDLNKQFNEGKIILQRLLFGTQKVYIL